MNKPRFEHFSLTCVTCGSRLRVTRRESIGTIESCPKCGAMVEISLPDTRWASDSPSPDSEDRLQVGSPEGIDSAAVTQSAVVNSTLPLDVSSEVAAIAMAPPTWPSPEDDDGAVASDEVPPDDGEVWQNASTQRTKRWILVTMLSMFGLVAAVIVFSQFARALNSQRTATNSETPPVVDQADAEALPTEESIPPEQPTEVNALPDTPAVAPAVEPATPIANGPETEPTIAATMPPEMIDPEVFPPAVIVEPRGDADEPPPLTALPPGMEKYTNLFSTATVANQPARVINAPPTIDTVRLDDAAAQVEPSDELTKRRKVIDVEKMLGQRFAVDNAGTSLPDLCLLVSQVTTVPIELDLISFDAAGIAVDAPIKTPPGWMTAAQWLDAVCQSQGLLRRVIDDRVIMAANDELVDRGIAAALRFDDLGDDGASVFAWLEPLLVEEDVATQTESDEAKEDEQVAAPEPTSLAADGQSIVPGPTLRMRVRAALACETVRLMRGLPPKLERWRTSRWLGKWPDAGANTDTAEFGEWPVIGGGQSGPPLDAPRAAAGMLLSLASRNQTSLLVNWRDALPQGLYPADAVMPYSADGTAGSLLEEVLGDFGLQARRCGPSVWCALSDAAYDRLEVFTWVEISDQDAEQVRIRMANSLGVEDVEALPIAINDKLMVVRCPRYLARQLARIVEPSP